MFSVYGEIGSGTRAALSKLAVEKKEQHNTNLRIAIDFSIWQYQIQAGKGGTNADLRTLFFRLLRLLHLSIEPLFVFDGPHKPPFKRNKKTSVLGGSALQLAAREFFDLFGFPHITAPGEAEAECALLQREGVVDAVLSEDVDTLMFGCTTHLRAWGPEDRKMKGGTATHVDVYKASEIKSGPSGLDREGLVLIALMSGGDYLPAGIPNCGIKIACEAARAGFGNDLQRIDRNDHLALRAWRDRLQHELRTNESNHFRTKHQTLEIPETFPDKAVLYYYSNPVVSTSNQVEKYRKELQWREPNVKRLQEACKIFFGWLGVAGFQHFTRNIAPALVGWRLANGVDRTNFYDDIDVQSAIEESLVKTISGSRTHPSTGNTPELRIEYVPQDIVGMTLDDAAREDLASGHDHTPSYSDIEQNVDIKDAEGTTESARKLTKSYDPSKIEKEWFPEIHVKLGASKSYEKWAAELRDPKKFATQKAPAKRRKKAAMPQGAILKYLAKKPRTEIPQNSKILPIQETDPTCPDNELFSLQPSLGYTLTELEFSSTSLASTVSRPSSSTNQIAQAIFPSAGHIRMKKSNYGTPAPIPTEMTDMKVNNKETSHGQLAFVSSKVHTISAEHERYLSSFQGRSNDAFAGSRRGRAKASSQNDVSDFCDIEILEAVCSSSGTNFSDHCNDSTLEKGDQRFLSSQQHFRARPNHNQWQSMDDEDILYETPAAKKNIPTYIDLTLS